MKTENGEMIIEHRKWKIEYEKLGTENGKQTIESEKHVTKKYWKKEN